VINYLDIKLKELSGETIIDHKPLNLFDMQNVDELRARNIIVSHVEVQLNEINGLAGFKKETSDETIKRLQKDLSK
jgi:hypothetical protein